MYVQFDQEKNLSYQWCEESLKRVQCSCNYGTTFSWLPLNLCWVCLESCTNRNVLLHKVCFVPELCHRLEHQGSAAHPQQTRRVIRVGKHSSCTQKPASVRKLEHRDPANRRLMSLLTSFVTVCQLLRDPLDRFGRDFGAEVSVKRRRSASLWGETAFKTHVFNKNILQVCLQVCERPAACGRGCSSCSQTLLDPPRCTAGRWSQWWSSRCSSRFWNTNGTKGLHLGQLSAWIFKLWTKKPKNFATSVYLHVLKFSFTTWIYVSNVTIIYTCNFCCGPVNSTQYNYAAALANECAPHLSTNPLWMLVFIFSVRCSTLAWENKPQVMWWNQLGPPVSLLPAGCPFRHRRAPHSTRLSGGFLLTDQLHLS